MHKTAKRRNGGNMNIICNGTQLSEALTRVTKALPVKKTIPILDGVKLAAYGNTLTLTATDTEFAIQKTINADVKIEGEVLVPGKLFGELIKKLSSEEQIEISYDEDQLVVIKYMDSVTSIKAMKLRDYPPIQEFEYETEFTMLQKDLKDMIIKTIFSAATDDVRPVLKGCLLELEGEEARCVALDGYRLAIARKKLEKTIPYTAVVVPAKNLSEIYKLLEEDEEQAKISICEKKISVDLKHTKIISNLLSGKHTQRVLLHYCRGFHSFPVANTSARVIFSASFFVSWRLQGALSFTFAPAPVLLYSA